MIDGDCEEELLQGLGADGLGQMVVQRRFAGMAPTGHRRTQTLHASHSDGTP